MNRPIKLLLATFVLLLHAIASAQTFSDSQFLSEEVVKGITAPIGFTWAPDTRMFVWEKAGRVRIVKDGQLLPTPFIDIRDHVNSNTDRGLLGLALDPNFSSNGYVYLAYVYENQGDTQSPNPRTQRVTRVRADPANPDVALPQETVLIGKVTDPNCDWSTDCSPNDDAVHTIDHLLFGPDGKLYVSIGEGANRSGEDQDRLRAQDLDALNGKILRINTDGTGVADNPFYDGNPNSNRSKVFNYGLRNPFRYWFDSRDGKLYIGDVGSYHYEEIDRGKGQNFGWPCFEGPAQNPNEATRIELCKTQNGSQVTPPFYSYARATDAATIILGPVYTATKYPQTYRNNIFFADFVGKWIKRLPINSDGTAGQAEYFARNLVSNSFDGPVYLALGPDGNLYYALIATGQIRRIKFTGDANQPPVVSLAANPSAGPSPLNVQFSSQGSSDPEGSALTYEWDFGDGSTSADPNPTHTYTAEGVKKFTAKLTVEDPEGHSTSESVVITVGSSPPTATIEAPEAGTLAIPGQVVEFRGSASDPDEGTLPGDKLTWEIFLHHNDHFHPVSTNTGVSGSFAVESHGEAGDTYSYLIRLTAKDTSGLTDVKELDIGIRGDSFVISVANGGTLSASVQAGQTATYTLQISGPPTLTGQVNLSCSGAPTGASCQVQPTQVSMAAGAPQPFTVTVATTAATAASIRRSSVLSLLGMLCGLTVLLCFPIPNGRAKRRLPTLLFGFMIMLVALAFASCGSDSGGNRIQPQARTPAGNYTIQVSGTSGQMSTSVDLGLTVQ